MRAVTVIRIFLFLPVIPVLWSLFGSIVDVFIVTQANIVSRFNSVDDEDDSEAEELEDLVSSTDSGWFELSTISSNETHRLGCWVVMVSEDGVELVTSLVSWSNETVDDTTGCASGMGWVQLGSVGGTVQLDDELFGVTNGSTNQAMRNNIINK